jgi:hypothetical protein
MRMDMVRLLVPVHFSTLTALESMHLVTGNFPGEKAIEELRVKDSLSFIDAWKKFPDSRPEAESQSYVSIASCSQGVSAAIQTSLSPTHNTTMGITKSHVIVTTKAKISTQAIFLILQAFEVGCILIKQCTAWVHKQRSLDCCLVHSGNLS